MELNESTLATFFSDYDSASIRSYLIKKFDYKPFTFFSANLNKNTMLISNVYHFYGRITEEFVEKNIVILDSFYHSTRYDSGIQTSFTSAVNNIPINGNWLISFPDDILVYMKLMNDMRTTVFFLGSLFEKMAALQTNTCDSTCFETRLDSIRSAETCLERLEKHGYHNSSQV